MGIAIFQVLLKYRMAVAFSTMLTFRVPAFRQLYKTYIMLLFLP